MHEIPAEAVADAHRAPLSTNSPPIPNSRMKTPEQLQAEKERPKHWGDTDFGQSVGIAIVAVALSASFSVFMWVISVIR